MPQNFYELVWIFIIYAFIGWCTEVSYAALDTGKFVNRGFLNGPYCPIYGCGVVIVVAILTPLKENLLILFAGSFLLTSVLEYITGYILEKVFHNKWWDYSDKPFNIKGYVCLKFSIYWGLACTFIMDIIHPIIYAAIRFIPFVLGVVLLSIIMCVFAADCIITVTTILKFNKRLKVMDEMAVHNCNTVGNMVNDQQIMRDKQIRHAQLVLQFLEHIYHLRLNGHIQCGYRLVTDDKLRVYRECSCNTDTLSLSAGKLMCITHGMLGIQSNQLHEVQDFLTALFFIRI